MPERPYEKLSKRFQEKVNDVLNRYRNNPDLKPEEFKKRIVLLVKKTSDEVQKDSALIEKLENIEEFTIQFSIQQEYKTWFKMYDEIATSYYRIYTKYNEIIEEEAIIKRIEIGNHRTTLFFRILTTFGIGLAIMAVYGIAEKIGIDMPLMRIT